tara:strand:+ start:4549 stop:5391 length:843 start_codon:yes stop_codon:yes gene_type:complete
MYWYQHDSNANMDAKLQEVLLDYGLEGYGLYWYCLELIVSKVDKDNVTFELEHDCRMIAKNTGSTVQKVQEMMQSMVRLGLFEQSEGAITCLKVAKRLNQSMTSNPKMREILSNIKGLEVGSAKCTTVMTESENVMQHKSTLHKSTLHNITSDNIKTCATALPIVDQVKVSFDQFWIAGMRKVNRKKALLAYKSQFKANKKNLDKVNPELHFANHLINDVKKRLELDQLGFSEMHPTTYLNGERWNDDYPEKRTSSDFAGQESTSNWADGLENEFHGVNK